MKKGKKKRKRAAREWAPKQYASAAFSGKKRKTQKKVVDLIERAGNRYSKWRRQTKGTPKPFSRNKKKQKAQAVG